MTYIAIILIILTALIIGKIVNCLNSKKTNISTILAAMAMIFILSIFCGWVWDKFVIN